MSWNFVQFPKRKFQCLEEGSVEVKHKHVVAFSRMKRYIFTTHLDELLDIHSYMIIHSWTTEHDVR